MSAKRRPIQLGTGVLERAKRRGRADQDDSDDDPRVWALDSARARTAPEKHSAGGVTRPAPIWPMPARFEAMPVLICGRIPVWTTSRMSMPVGVPRKFRMGSVYA